MRHSDNLMRKIKLLTSCQSMQQLMDAGFEIIGNPMFVTDLMDNVLAYTKSVRIDDPEWVSTIEKGSVSLTFVSSEEIAVQSSKARKASVDSKMPVLDQNTPQKIPVLVKSLLIDDVPVGFFVVAGYFKPFSDEDIELVELTSCKVLLELQRNKFLRNSRVTFLDHFILSLLDHGSRPAQIIEERLNYLKWRLAAFNYVLAIFARNTMAPVSLKEVVAELATKPNCKAIVYHGRIVCIFSANKEILHWETEQNQLKQFLDNRQLVAGVSRCFNNLMELQEYHLQAVKAIEMGPSLAKDRTFFAYEDVAVYHLLELCAKVTDLYAFCHPAVLKLKKHDQDHGTDFLSTLTVYLKCDKSLSKTADTMYLHRNTIRYRIDQSVNILNLDLKNNDDVFCINLTLNILAYLKNKR